MVAGRPSEYREEYCERVIELGKEGMSVVEMAAEIGVHRETLEQNWPTAHEEFSEAFARARLLSQAWWERKGRESLTTPGFQASVWSRSMAARFPRDWRETRAHEHSGPEGSPIAIKSSRDLTDEELAAIARGGA